MPVYTPGDVPYRTDDDAFSFVSQVTVAVVSVVEDAIFDITGAVVSGVKTVNDLAVVVEVFPKASVTLVYKLYVPGVKPVNVF